MPRGQWNLPGNGACVNLDESDKKRFFTEADSTSTQRDWQYAKSVCAPCPIREQCLKMALDNAVIDGVWGGRDENALRRAQSVDSHGVEKVRNRAPNCINCSSRTPALRLIKRATEGGGRWNHEFVVHCNNCSFEWVSRTGYNGVLAYWRHRRQVIQEWSRHKTGKRPNDMPGWAKELI